MSAIPPKPVRRPTPGDPGYDNAAMERRYQDRARTNPQWARLRVPWYDEHGELIEDDAERAARLEWDIENL